MKQVQLRILKTGAEGAWQGKPRPGALACLVRMRARPDALTPPSDASFEMLRAHEAALSAWAAFEREQVARPWEMDFREDASAGMSPLHRRQHAVISSVLTRDSLRRARNPVRSDFLHGHEDIARALACAATGLPTWVIRPAPGGLGEEILGPPGKDIDLDVPLLWPGMGPPPSAAWGAEWIRGQQDAARGYWRLPAFGYLAGREMFHFESLGEVACMLAAMRCEGHDKAFVKAAAFKRGTWTVSLPPSATNPDKAMAALVRVAGRSSLDLPQVEAESGWLVQEWRCMEGETRVFVVDRKVVGAVPVRREDSVLLPPSEPFPGFEERLSFARDAVALLGETSPHLRDYVLDVAQDEDGKPFAIELNPITSSGLYGMRPAPIVQAMLEASLLSFAQPPGSPAAMTWQVVSR